MNNYASEVNKRIEELIMKRDKSLMDIQLKLAESRGAVKNAKDIMDQAIFDADLKRFKKARTERDEAESEVEMYEGRLEQLQEKAFVTAAESESVIDHLLDYENDLAEQYRKDIEEPIRSLREIHNAYIDAVQQAELVMKDWTNRIRGNYKSYTGTVYQDGSCYSDRPIPVRVTAYQGCDESREVDRFLKRTASE